MVSYWSFADRKSPQVSRTLLYILADLNAVVWMVSTCFLIFKSSSPFFQFEFQVHQLQLVWPSSSYSIVLFSSLARSRYLSLFSLFFNFTLWFAETAKSTFRQVLFFVDYHSVWLLLLLSLLYIDYWASFSFPSSAFNLYSHHLHISFILNICISFLFDYLYTSFSSLNVYIISVLQYLHFFFISLICTSFLFPKSAYHFYSIVTR